MAIRTTSCWLTAQLTINLALRLARGVHATYEIVQLSTTIRHCRLVIWYRYSNSRDRYLYVHLCAWVLVRQCCWPAAAVRRNELLWHLERQNTKKFTVEVGVFLFLLDTYFQSMLLGVPSYADTESTKCSPSNLEDIWLSTKLHVCWVNKRHKMARWRHMVNFSAYLLLMSTVGILWRPICTRLRR